MSEEDKPKKSGSKGNDSLEFLITAMVCAAIFLLILPITIIASIISWFILRFQSKKVSAALILLSITMYSIHIKSLTLDYIHWATAIFGKGNTHWYNFPYFTILWSSILLGAIFRLFIGSAAFGTISKRASGRFYHKLPAALGGKKGNLTASLHSGGVGTGSAIPVPGGNKSTLTTSRAGAETLPVKIPVPSSGNIADLTRNSNSLDVVGGKRLIPLGSRDGHVVGIKEEELNTHMMIFGSTGSGKSEAIKTMIGALMDLGWSGMVLDLKEDAKIGGLYDWCQTYAHFKGLPFQQLRLSDPDPEMWFNSIAGMGPDEARDTILSLNSFEAAYWEAINKKQLGQICTLMFEANEVNPERFDAPSMLDIGRVLGSPDLPNAVKAMAATVLQALPGRSKEDFSALLTPSKDEAESAVGFGAKLTSIYETRAGRVVLRPGTNRTALDVTAEGLTYIGLDSLGKPDMTKMISSSVLQRMSVYASERTTASNGKSVKPRFLVIDEANFIHRRIVANLLSRARSAGIAVVLCTQGPKDFEVGSDANMPGFAALAQNCNIALIMSQGDMENAELAAEHVGKRDRADVTQKVTLGELDEAGTMRLVRDYIVAPDKLREFGVGEGVIRVGKPNHRVEMVKITMRDPRS